MSEKIKVTESSGNVFADLGLDNAQERLAKAELATVIAYVIESRRLTQVEAARIMGIDQPKVSNLIRGRLSGFSTDRLLGFLIRLERDITITVSEPEKKRQGQLTVCYA